MPLGWALTWCNPSPSCLLVPTHVLIAHTIATSTHGHLQPDRSPGGLFPGDRLQLVPPGMFLSAMHFEVPYACFVAIGKTLQRLPTQNTFALLTEATGERQGHLSIPQRAEGACTSVSQQPLGALCLQAEITAHKEVPCQCQCCGTTQLHPGKMGDEQVCRKTSSSFISWPVLGH